MPFTGHNTLEKVFYHYTLVSIVVLFKSLRSFYPHLHIKSMCVFTYLVCILSSFQMVFWVQGLNTAGENHWFLHLKDTALPPTTFFTLPFPLFPSFFLSNLYLTWLKHFSPSTLQSAFILTQPLSMPIGFIKAASSSGQCLNSWVKHSQVTHGSVHCFPNEWIPNLVAQCQGLDWEYLLGLWGAYTHIYCRKLYVCVCMCTHVYAHICVRVSCLRRG